VVFKADNVPVDDMVGGVGFTVIVNVTGVPLQLTPGVIKFPNASGPVPTLIVAATVLVVVLITETVFENLSVIYAKLPSAFIEAPDGSTPCAIVATSALLAVLITETVALPSFATYSRVPSGLTVTPFGNEPAGMLDTTDTIALVAVLITVTAAGL